ncbi:MAG TPA: tryptophan--tRNA ligase [Candidatus Dormibacteraeota bacterium]|nr:tryptophan--tRNA ligase [Candidatus Dormibacteraeota bacterium]
MATATDGKPRVFSGIQPDASPHLGNYLGAIRNWVRNQNRYENIFCIVDLHAITLPQDPAKLREFSLELAAIYLASGISEQAAIFIQSQVSAHAELAWVFECFTPIGWLERMTQFKDRTVRQGRERIGAGVLTYPSLMAADIMLYDARYVPVGEDQRQHLEYTRDIGQRMNQRFGNILVIPDPLIEKAGAEIKGLDDPEKKMSKSLARDSPGHAIFMLDPPDVIRRKIARAQTDTQPEVRFPAGPGIMNLLEIYRTIRQKEWPDVEKEFAGKPYSVVKSAVADAVIEALEPIQRRYREIRSDDDNLRQHLQRAAERLTPIANATLGRVQKAVGLR